ncbi:uncharacterized protein LOC133716362 [Rosa rugosa]|uniref:uncharacterized protein LOC133716362 n=1 Tax=Rosa rugosa TaxID=74645 RepID=UPI002B40516B|nr:uncharacterized protein LOC133716362 [Rosa rugosa]
MILSATWRNRNAKVWEGDFKQVSQLVPMTLGWLEEYKVAHITPKSGLAARTPPKWKKPPVGFIKLNVDAAFDQTSCRAAGLGGVFRDHIGAFLHGFRHTIIVAHSARHVELLALVLGVQLAVDNHLTPLLVETDCLDLVSALSSSLDSSELGFLLADLRVLLHKAQEAHVLKVGRQANGVAHILAHEAKHADCQIDFFSCIPPSVEASLISYCNDSPSMN